MIEDLNAFLEPYQITCSKEQLIKFRKFYQLLIEWNNKMNLTAITEENEVLVKHFFDSITPSFFYELNNQSIIDIGVGAGFPSIPLKICFPHLKMTLVDSLNKRIVFLNEVIKELELKHIRTIHGRAEELAKNKKYRETFDISISRAVAKLNVISEFSLPFVKVGGTMIALKGSNADEEIKDSKKALDILGASFFKSYSLDLPNNYGNRNIIVINKVKNTPFTYPRKAGEPTKKPIL